MQDTKHESNASEGSASFLSTLPVFEGLEARDFAEVEARSSTIVLTPGEALLEQGRFTDSVYILTSGVLDVLGPAGSTSARARLIRGDLFGGAVLPFYMPAATALVASEPCEIIGIAIATLQSLLQNRPAVRERVIAEASRHIRRMQLASLPMFSELEGSLFAHVAANSEFVSVSRGTTVIRKGDKPDCLYIVACGSLEVFLEQQDGSVHTIDILPEGACVGEMGLLLNEPRSVNVRAWRDSILIRVPDHCVQEVFQRDAQVALRLARTLSERLKRTTIAVRRIVPVKTIAIIPWCQHSYFAAFCERLRLAFQAAADSVTLLSSSVMREETRGAPYYPELGHDRYSIWLAAKEQNYQYVLCQCEAETSEWTERSIRQADLILFVCQPGRDRPGVPAGPGAEAVRMSGARLELVLLRDSAAAPQGTSAWLELAGFAAHHHVGLESDHDHERLVRRLSGKAWGLVLSGGGARGLAHIGAIRAMRESGLPIDMIGGTSMGAIIAALYAAGQDPEEMLAAARKAYTKHGGPGDLTLPFVSLRTGRSTIATLRTMFGERRIEDLPISYFCVSCNLTRAEAVIHERGPVWMWTRVSCSVPGLLPPFPHRGDVLIDGGLLDNLPVEAMRKRLGGYVAAADVSVAVDLAVNSELESEGSWSGVSQLLRRWTKQPRLPNIVDLLMRTAEVSSVRDSKISGSPADLYLHLPVDKFSMTNFEAIDQIEAIGYEYAMRRIEEWHGRGGVNQCNT